MRAMFLILKTVYFNGYADDNVCFVVAGKIKDLIRYLEEVAGNIIGFYKSNEAEYWQCHLLLNTSE